MSNSTKPRTLKLKKLPKGKFNWKVCLRLIPGHNMSWWDRYCGERQELPAAFFEYLEHQVQGKYHLHEIKSKYQENKSYKRYDYIWFENQFDVTMFKLVHGDLIRRIYRVKVED